MSGLDVELDKDMGISLRILGKQSSKVTLSRAPAGPGWESTEGA